LFKAALWNLGTNQWRATLEVGGRNFLDEWGLNSKKQNHECVYKLKPIDKPHPEFGSLNVDEIVSLKKVKGFIGLPHL
jgi:hypothetical protein